MSAETNAPAGYRNWIKINDNGGYHDIAHADQATGWKFPVNLHPPGSNLGSATVMAGSVLAILHLGDETIEGTGRLVTFSWTLGQCKGFRFLANPYNKKLSGDGYAIRTLLIRPNDYYFQLDDAEAEVGIWNLEISITGNPEAEFTLLVDEQPDGTLGQGKQSFENLKSKAIGVGANKLKGDVEIGYTLDQTG